MLLLSIDRIGLDTYPPTRVYVYSCLSGPAVKAVLRLRQDRRQRGVRDKYDSRFVRTYALPV